MFIESEVESKESVLIPGQFSKKEKPLRLVGIYDIEKDLVIQNGYSISYYSEVSSFIIDNPNFDYDDKIYFIKCFAEVLEKHAKNFPVYQCIIDKLQEALYGEYSIKSPFRFVIIIIKKEITKVCNDKTIALLEKLFIETVHFFIHEKLFQKNMDMELIF